MSNPFFKNYGPLLIFDILKILKINLSHLKENIKVNDIKDLYTSNKSDITFFHSKKYNQVAKNTKASFCITTESLKNELPATCIPLVVENVLVSTSTITSMFYPDSINDNFDETVLSIDDTHFKDKVSFGKNVLIGSNVSIGHNCNIIFASFWHNRGIIFASVGHNCGIIFASFGKLWHNIGIIWA